MSGLIDFSASCDVALDVTKQVARWAPSTERAWYSNSHGFVAGRVHVASPGLVCDPVPGGTLASCAALSSTSSLLFRSRYPFTSSTLPHTPTSDGQTVAISLGKDGAGPLQPSGATDAGLAALEANSWMTDWNIFSVLPGPTSSLVIIRWCPLIKQNSSVFDLSRWQPKELDSFGLSFTFCFNSNLASTFDQGFGILLWLWALRICLAMRICQRRERKAASTYPTWPRLFALAVQIIWLCGYFWICGYLCDGQAKRLPLIQLGFGLWLWRLAFASVFAFWLLL